MVRFELMDKFRYYVTESSEHNAEYHPYFMKNRYPELIKKFNIPLDEYPRRCVKQIEGWKMMRQEMVNKSKLTHTRSHEYGSRIIEAMETNEPFKFDGNVLNTGRLTSNLTENACVEVPCVVDRCVDDPGVLMDVDTPGISKGTVLMVILDKKETKRTVPTVFLMKLIIKHHSHL